MTITKYNAKKKSFYDIDREKVEGLQVALECESVSFVKLADLPAK